MAAVVTNLVHKYPPSKQSDKSVPDKNNQPKDVDRSNNNTPVRSRRIVPKPKNSVTAWSKETQVCDDSIPEDLYSNIISHRKYSTSLYEEKSVLISSQRSSSELDSSSSSVDHQEDQRISCNYIIISEKIDENSIKCSQYDQLLSPSSTACQSIDDDSISIDIIKNIKRREKPKRPYLKFLCPPYFILAASLLEISVFIWGGEEVEALLMYSPHHRYQVWRFFSYMLLHSGGIHLTLNIIIQTLLATLLELEQGSWRCAVVYVGGGVAGALGASVLQPSLYMVGASAGVYALLISHLANVILRFSQLSYRVFRIFSVAVLAASDIAFSIAHWWSADSSAPCIGWAAHCAGAVAGATLGILIYTGCDEDAIYNKVARWTSFVILIVAFIISVIYNIFIVKIS